MKKYLAILLIYACATASNAGLITHTDYSSGGTITAAGQNANENAIVNELNGNIESANIKDATITTADISASAGILHTQLSSTVQSTFTWVNTHGYYRRPNLIWISATTIDVENNTGTSNETCIQFPDERRCVTENTGSTSVNRRFIITESASLTGTKNSGLKSGYVEAVNTTYVIYAVKASDVSTDFVMVGDTVTPTQGNFSALNTAYGTNGYVFIGYIRNGDAGGTTGDILSFTQSGHLTMFSNTGTGGNFTGSGILMATNAASTSTSWFYQVGISSRALPGTISQAYWFCAGNSFLSMRDATANYITSFAPAAVQGFSGWVAANKGIAEVNNTSTIADCWLEGYVDGVLGVGYNPQL